MCTVIPYLFCFHRGQTHAHAALRAAVAEGTVRLWSSYTPAPASMAQSFGENDGRPRVDAAGGGGTPSAGRRQRLARAAVSLVEDAAAEWLSARQNLIGLEPVTSLGT